MAIAKAERLMNLALCLLGRGGRSASANSASPSRPIWKPGRRLLRTGCSSATRDDLRELGLVIETVENLDGEVGYLARRDSNRLPPITLDAEEAAALGLAAKVWQQARLAGAASGALQKLRAAGLPEDFDPYEAHSALEPHIPVHEAAFEPLMPPARPPPGRLRLPQGHRRAPRDPAGRAVGAGVLARPLVPGGLGPRPRRRARLQALADHRQGPLPRRAVHRRGARRRHRAGDRGELGGRDRRPLRADPAAHRLRLPAAGQSGLRTGTRRRLGRVEIPYDGLDAWLVSGPTWWSWSPPSCGPMSWTGCAPWPRAEGERRERGRKNGQAHERDRPDPADAVPGDLSARAPGARVGDVARAFGITEDELISDLDVLPLSGPSFRGGDLLDIDTDGDRIWWHNPDLVAEPLRIAADEATASVAARAVYHAARAASRATGRRCCAPPPRWRPPRARRRPPAPASR